MAGMGEEECGGFKESLVDLERGKVGWLVQSLTNPRPTISSDLGEDD